MSRALSSCADPHRHAGGGNRRRSDRRNPTVPRSRGGRPGVGRRAHPGLALTERNIWAIGIRTRRERIMKFHLSPYGGFIMPNICVACGAPALGEGGSLYKVGLRKHM